jgi:hypothetical protein
MDDEVRRALAEKVSVPVEIAGRAFGLSRGAAYTAVRNGQIPSLKIGGKYVIPTAPIRRMLGLDRGEAA